MNQSKSKDFFLNFNVESNCYTPIKERFRVLLDSKKIIQQNLADHLNLDRAYISRIVNGLEIPPHHMRIKISFYFGVDSSTIWRIEDLDYLKFIIDKQKLRLKNG